MQKKEDEYYEIDLLHLVKVLLERIWLIIISAIIAGGACFSYAYFLVEPKYQSSALFYVNNSSFSVGNTEFSISSSQISAAQSLVDTYIVILKSRTTLEEVIDKAGLSYGCEELSTMIDASAVNSTEIFRVNVKSTDPAEAANIANTICAVLPRTISNVVDGSDVRIVDYAVVSNQRVSPSYTKYTSIGIAVGIVISALIIILSDMLDDVIHDTEYISQSYNIPVLSIIPNLVADELAGYNDKYKYKGAHYDSYQYYNSKKGRKA